MSDALTDLTDAPTDLTSGMPATAGQSDSSGLSADELALFSQIADRLIPAAHGMPSAADVVTEGRLTFVLRARPDLMDPLKQALRPELSADVDTRLAALSKEPTNLAGLQLVLVAGYYTDKQVRELIGYPGQMAIEVKSWLLPQYIEEGLIDAVLQHGPVWRDPATGQRAVVATLPKSYSERFAHRGTAEQGGDDGRDRA
jgi:hypothetical protein